MATTTPNFGWPVPTSTDLVKDGATAIEALGDGIDASLVDLRGGTTGQILAKATNADMDFAWITNDVGDITAVTAGTGISGGGTSGAVTITNSMATEIAAKGDLIVGTGSQTFDNLTAGSNGDYLLADSSTATGLRWQGDYAAGKNKIINGDFGINQRAFTSTTTSGAFGFDRFNLTTGGDGTTTYSAQTFTIGSAPVTGYEGTNFAQLVTTGQTNTSVLSSLSQKIESVRTFAAQTITVSFWAKASSGTPNITAFAFQNFGSGGSTGVFTGSTKRAISTSWARYSFVIAVPSISGKTIGAGDHLRLDVCVSAGSTRDAYTDTLGIQTGTFQIWGVQAEAGSVATAFQTASGSVQGELALCQRYLPAISGNVNSIFGWAYSTTGSQFSIKFPVTARAKITGITVNGTLASNYQIVNQGFTGGTPTAIAFNNGGLDYATINVTTTAGSPTLVLSQPATFSTLTADGYILFTGAEL